MSFSHHKLLIANRGEIASRILRTTKRLGIPTVAVYTRTDATSPHVLEAEEAVALRDDNPEPSSNAQGYLDAAALVEICKSKQVTLVHPGYGFLSENANFAQMLHDAGITLLGPSVEVIRDMGLKHLARAIAIEADVPVVPGSNGLLHSEEEAVGLANRIGYPVMLKSTAGGGGMGLVICKDADELRSSFSSTQARAKSLFHDDGVFLERYFPSSRHIEIQIFGNGLGHVIHMGERECSVQRRHQKVIEEAPSPYLQRHPDVQKRIFSAAVRLCSRINYKSAGTCEFIVDDATGDFYFLEMNTRLQVEHPVTEMLHHRLDIVKLMIFQGIAERDNPADKRGLDPSQLSQDDFFPLPNSLQCKHAIEARVYCENPSADFKPCPGQLQHVSFPIEKWLRIDSWVRRGTTITPFYDPLACKVVVYGPSREEAILRLSHILEKVQIYGPPNNIAYLRAICASEIFKAGNALTTFLRDFIYTPRAVDVLSGGLETTVQDWPGRSVGLGIPFSGPMDSIAFRAANALVRNPFSTEALEIVLPAGMAGPKFLFHVKTVVAVTGASVIATVDGDVVPSWARIVVPAGGVLALRGLKVSEHRGFRMCLAVRGGFPQIPKYLGSKSTSMGLGGYQGRALLPGDQLVLGKCGPDAGEVFPFILPSAAIPKYPSEWTVYTLSGPHDDSEFITPSGIEAFYNTKWNVSSSSNRMGIRLEGPQIDWARKNGGEGGSHPSNIHDNAYAVGSVNINGDTPVILTNDGPSMGGYVCATTVASADLWKVGQIQPGSIIQFRSISWSEAMAMMDHTNKWLETVLANVMGFSATLFSPLSYNPRLVDIREPKLSTIPAATDRPRVIFRQAGDSAILIEFGELELDMSYRARIHAFETEMKKKEVDGIEHFAPCIRSTMCHYDPTVLTQEELVAELIEAENCLPSSVYDMEFPGRRITFPIVLDDKWNQDAIARYMATIREKAVYLPSNVDYLAKNNGLESGERALDLLASSTWLVFGVGFYLACPFLVPIDPRSRLVAQKMNPSRTFTPRGAIGIAGLVAAIYPVESPGGYQLFGRTLPSWQTWGLGYDFEADKPWLLQPFDQVVFERVSEEQYSQLLRQFDAGLYTFKIEDVKFSMADYYNFIAGIEKEILSFRSKQAESVADEESKEEALLHEWRESKQKSTKEELTSVDTSEGSSIVSSSLAGSIWKITVKPGDTIRSSDETVLILEAMKTEIKIEAGEENVGRKVKGFGANVREGVYVSAGEALVFFE